MRQLYSFYSDAFRIAVGSILEQKLRATLTLIGIIIGVAAVIVVGASISGLKTYVVGQVTKVLGSNHFMITRMASVGNLSDEEYERLNRQNKEVTWEEYGYIRDNCSLCSYVGAQVNGSADLNEGGIELPATRIIGITDNMYEIEDKTISDGRFFISSDIARSAKLAVIGHDVLERFFPDGRAIGKTIKIRGIPVEIIGVEESRGSIFGQSQDRHIYIPITFHNQIFARTGGIAIHGKTIEQEDFHPAIEEANNLMRIKRKLRGDAENTFATVNTEEFGSQMDQFTGAIAAVVIPITMIILVVGGIVVMNIMLVSVTERTFEVGLRKALGATRRQILSQFLIESSMLCVIGGFIGLVAAVLITEAVGYMLQITMTITFGYVILSVAVSTSIGVLAGLYPAWKAARLDPIVALTKN